MRIEKLTSEVSTMINGKVDYYYSYYMDNNERSDSLKLYTIKRLFSLRELSSKLDDENLIPYCEYEETKEKIEKIMLEISKS